MTSHSKLPWFLTAWSYTNYKVR